MFSCANLLLRCGPLPLTSWHRQLPSPLRARYVFGASSRFTRLHHLPENSTVRIYLEKSFEISYNFERIISKLTASHLKSRLIPSGRKVGEFATSILRFVRLFSTSIRDKRKEQKEKNLIYIPVRIAPFVHPGEKPLETRIFAKTRFFHDSAANRVANVELALTRRFAPDKATLFAEFANRERS